MQLTLGDSLEKLKELGDNSVDSVVTDPPYGLAFMGKKWDYDVPSVELWREVLRVLKPGGHLLSFGGTRTYHRMVVNIEDAGFEIRDQIMWLYGSGFPKSLDVSKAIDRAAGAEREVIGHNPKWNSKPRAMAPGEAGRQAVPAYTAPATDDAKRWQGWGTALKPANEPIVLARKPLEKGLTVAENVKKWGCGALNIDGTRIAGSIPQGPQPLFNTTGSIYNMKTGEGRNGEMSRAEGRWPANVIFDEEAAQLLDEQSGTLISKWGKQGKTKPKSMFYGEHSTDVALETDKYIGDSGGASRFFYVAKASKRERNAGLEGMPERVRNITEGHGRGSINTSKGDGTGIRENKPCANVHPTVKPVRLMEYLIKLVTPPNGIVLDPFMGSGTTGCAAVKLGFNFIGIEREQEYVEIAKRRIEKWKEEKEEICLDEKNQLTMNI